MNRKIMTLLTLLFSGAAQKIRFNRMAYTEIANLKLKLFYLRVVKSCRLLFLSQCAIGLCLVLLFSGLVLFHATFFLYAPCGAGVKMWVGFISSGIYLLIAAKFMTGFLSESKWIDIFYAQGMYKDLDGAKVSAKMDKK